MTIALKRVHQSRQKKIIFRLQSHNESVSTLNLRTYQSQQILSKTRRQQKSKKISFNYPKQRAKGGTTHTISDKQQLTNIQRKLNNNEYTQQKDSNEYNL